MEHYAAIDVSLEWSSICIVDPSGGIVREAKVRSEREAVVVALEALGDVDHQAQVGLDHAVLRGQVAALHPARRRIGNGRKRLFTASSGRPALNGRAGLLASSRKWVKA